MTRTDSVCHKGGGVSKPVLKVFVDVKHGEKGGPVARATGHKYEEPLGVLQSGVGGDGNHKASNCVRVAPLGRDAPSRNQPS